MGTTHLGDSLGTTQWRLIGIARGAQSCEHCARALTNLYWVVNPTGREMVVGRGCVKLLTGWTLTAAEAARLLRVAERNARRAVQWARFEADHPNHAALIQSDVEDYERQASAQSGAGASHEIRDWISDSYTDHPDWATDRVATYMRRRPTFWWVRG